MATYETSNFAAQNEARVKTSRNAPANVASGDIQFATIPYTIRTPATEASPDKINLCVLPAGVIPLPHLSSVVTVQDVGTTLTIDIGTAADPDGWAMAININTPGNVSTISNLLPAWLAHTPLVADAGSSNAAVFATIASASPPLTAGVVIYFNLAYKIVR